jgi:hypothetical protein
MRGLLALVALGVFVGVVGLMGRIEPEARPVPVPVATPSRPEPFKPSRHAQALSGMHAIRDLDDSGFMAVWRFYTLKPDPFDPRTSGATWVGAGYRGVEILRRELEELRTPIDRLEQTLQIVRLFLYEGDAPKARLWLAKARSMTEPKDSPVHHKHDSVLMLQAITALRIGETQNCVQMNCQSSCILPIDKAAVHGKPAGSVEAVGHLKEYLKFKPDSVGAKWLLNIALMTLGQYPEDVPKEHLIPPATFTSKVSIGKFTNVARRLGVDRMDLSGSAVMDDFDNDGLLDIAQCCFAPDATVALWRNKGDGTFEDLSKPSKLEGETSGGGFRMCQTDYNNDGWLDLYISRSAYGGEVSQSLVRNNRDGTFTDVTRAAKLHYPINSLFGCWADYDNDGWLDLWVGSHTDSDRGRLYRNLRDGTFQECALKAGVYNKHTINKGGAWGDFDRDGWPDLYLSNWPDTPKLYRNNRDGTFSDVLPQVGIDGPRHGFSTFWFDYDNDGWSDLFCAVYEGDLDEAVKSLMGKPHGVEDLRIWRNVEGKRFEDATERLGMKIAPICMGSNFLDADNDGFLDLYLGTGAPPYSMLLPNRLFKNMDGKRFEDITFSSGTGHLQKGHGISCGDWNRDGQTDIFAQMGGAVPGDPFGDALFHNPGHPENHWLTVKLVGVKTNRPAILARIVVTAGGRKIYRTVDPGSSFGCNGLTQTIGIGPATKIDAVEIIWPTTRTTQRFENVACDQAIQITEFEKDYKKLGWTKVPFKL